jgi:ribosomal protein S18 acetylase RimI-like enzyme
MNTYTIRDARGETAALNALYQAYLKALPHCKQRLVANAIPPQLLSTSGQICFQDASPMAALLWRTTEEGIAMAEFYAECRGVTKEAVQALARGFMSSTQSTRAQYFELWTPENAKVLEVLREEGFEQFQRQLLSISKPLRSPALWNQFRFLSLRNFGTSPAGCQTIAKLLQEAYTGTGDGSFYEEYQRPEMCQAYVARVLNSPFCDVRNSWLAWSPSANRLAGIALSYIWPRASALYLEQLVVHPLFRGKGLGRALLSAVCGPLSDGAVQQIILTVSKNNQPALGLLRAAETEAIHSELAFVHKQTARSSGGQFSAAPSVEAKSSAPSRNQPEPVLG